VSAAVAPRGRDDGPLMPPLASLSPASSDARAGRRRQRRAPRSSWIGGSCHRLRFHGSRRPSLRHHTYRLQLQRDPHASSSNPCRVPAPSAVVTQRRTTSAFPGAAGGVFAHMRGSLRFSMRERTRSARRSPARSPWRVPESDGRRSARSARRTSRRRKVMRPRYACYPRGYLARKQHSSTVSHELSNTCTTCCAMRPLACSLL
jgi:hypothetical protein